MPELELPYTLLQRGENEWRFEESAETSQMTEAFDGIIERTRGSREMTSALRKFLNRHPYHIDALHHYSICKRRERKLLDALVFAETAVAIGKAAFHDGFRLGRDRLPTGWVQNRPFLRAVHHLMLLRWEVGRSDEAIMTGEECLELDPEDRCGARLSLPTYYLATGRARSAVELFEGTRYSGTFHCVEYLHALALFSLSKHQEAGDVLDVCLQYHPNVAKYLVVSGLEIPENESMFGIRSGSEYEGYFYAASFRPTWLCAGGALPWLRDRYEACSGEEEAAVTQSREGRH